MSDIRESLTRLLLSTINERDQRSAQLSRTLHDEVGQVLSAVGLQLDVLKLDFRQQLPEITERVDDIQKMLDNAVQEVRAMSYQLNPGMVERAGLQFSLERLSSRLERETGTTIRILTDPSMKVPLPIANAWYKIAEHALENALRHSGGSMIEIVAKTSPRSASLEIRDNGKGFSVVEARDKVIGLGLLLMNHYAAQVGSELQIRSSSSRGTTVRMIHLSEAPLQPASKTGMGQSA